MKCIQMQHTHLQTQTLYKRSTYKLHICLQRQHLQAHTYKKKTILCTHPHPPPRHPLSHCCHCHPSSPLDGSGRWGSWRQTMTQTSCRPHQGPCGRHPYLPQKWDVRLKHNTVQDDSWFNNTWLILNRTCGCLPLSWQTPHKTSETEVTVHTQFHS